MLLFIVDFPIKEIMEVTSYHRQATQNKVRNFFILCIFLNLSFGHNNLIKKMQFY